MEGLTIFSNPKFGKIRTLNENGTVLFCGKDAAAALGYSKPENAISQHCPHSLKRRVGVQTGTRTDGAPAMQNVEMSFIPESDLYRLVFGSKLPSAEEFTDWVTIEVLPAIRKTGSYGMPTIEQRKTKILETESKIRLADQMLRVWDIAGIKPIYQALAMNSYYEELSLPREAFPKDNMALLDLTAIAKDIGIRSESGKPDAQAVGAIIKKLELCADEYAETPYCRNGHDGISMQYKPSVETKISQWLNENGYPKTVTNGKSTYRIKYDMK